MLTIEVTSVQVQRKKKLTFHIPLPRHLIVLHVRSAQMSELSRFVYMKSHLTLHMKASAQKVNLDN